MEATIITSKGQMRDIYSANENSSTIAMVPHNGGRCRSKDNCLVFDLSPIFGVDTVHLI